MRNDEIVNMTMFIPKTLLSNIPVDLSILKDVIEVPVHGDLRRPQMDIPTAALKSTKLVPDNLGNLLNPKPKPPGVIGQPSK